MGSRLFGLLTLSGLIKRGETEDELEHIKVMLTVR